ncbi:LysM peptidoglycan-binding domain-containing protein [Brachyspira sp.]|uniref:LysM peptidoglycan-binding domain-containing protein n=1 Tax=Brachyspira sp. TaxID=1977261 RepID=UPI003D7D259D
MIKNNILKIFTISILSYSLFGENYINYKVENGDTLYGIAFSHGMSASEFLRLNNIEDADKYNLKIGETLKVKEKEYSLVFDSVNKSYALDVDKSKSYKNYKVKNGDTVLGIAFSHGMSASEFCAINNIKDFNRYNLKVGEILKVANNIEKNSDSSVNRNSVENIKKEIESNNQKPQNNNENNFEIYTVKNGDTLFGIAFDSNTPVNDFLRINNIESPLKYKLKIGEKLKIFPQKNKNNTVDDKKITSVYKVKKGDTLSAIAINNSMSLNELLELNGLNRNYLLKIGDNIKVYNKINLNNNFNNQNSTPKREYRKIEDYKIKKGDTLSEIAVAKGMDLLEIYSLNGLNDKSIIKVDEIIKVYAEKDKKTALVDSTYSVKKGDTLYSIARNHKMVLADLLQLNDIKDLNNYTLQAGAILKVKILKTIYTDFDDLPESSFIFPYIGSIVSKYGTDENNLANRGINISGKAGDKVVAADYGIVEYSDDIRGFGKAIIIKHKNGYTTAYAHLSESKVKAGDIVNKGDYIGNIGDTGMINKNELYFKISYLGMPIDPLKLLNKD